MLNLVYKDQVCCCLNVTSIHTWNRREYQVCEEKNCLILGIFGMYLGNEEQRGANRVSNGYRHVGHVPEESCLEIDLPIRFAPVHKSSAWNGDGRGDRVEEAGVGHNISKYSHQLVLLGSIQLEIGNCLSVIWCIVFGCAAVGGHVYRPENIVTLGAIFSPSGGRFLVFVMVLYQGIGTAFQIRIFWFIWSILNILVPWSKSTLEYRRCL